MVLPTLAQLKAELYWGREIVTPELRWLGEQLCAAYGRPATAWGTKGNYAHLYGAHRSQEWLLESRWCGDRQYTVQRGLTATQARHIGAADFTPAGWGTPANRQAVTLLTRRLVAAGVAGRLPGVWEVIGTLDGRTPVGVDLPEGTTWPASTDHLDHGHLTFDRRQMTNQAVMERVLAVALGEDEEVATSKDEWLTLVRYDDAVPAPENWPSTNKALSVATALSEILKRSVHADGQLNKVDRVLATQSAALDKVAASLGEAVELLKAGGGNPDLAPILPKLDAIATAIAGMQAEQAEIRKRLATAFGTG